MSKFLDEFSFTTKIAAGFIAIIALLVIQLVLSTSGFQEIGSRFTVLVRTNNNAAVIERSLLEAEVALRNFLLTDEVSHGLTAEKSLEKLITAANGEQKAGKPSAITSLARGYITDLESLISVRKIRGLTEEKGLRGKFRTAVHDLEEQLKGFDLSEFMRNYLLLRRWEKDWVRVQGQAAQQDKYRTRLTKTLSVYQALLASAPCEANSRALQKQALEKYSASIARVFGAKSEAVRSAAYANARQAAHDCEKAINDAFVAGAQVLVLQIRRREKDYVIRGKAKYVGKVEALCSQLQTKIAETNVPRETKAALLARVKEYRASFLALVGQDRAAAALNKKLDARSAKIRETVVALIQATGSAATDEEARIAELVTARISFGLLIGALAVVAAIGFVIGTIRSTVSPLIAVTDRVEAMTAGEIDLTARLALSRGDEVGRLGRVFDDFLGRLETLVKATKENSEELDTTAAELLASAQQQQTGANQQASSVEEAKRTLESLLASARQIATVSQDVFDSAESSQKNSQIIAGSISDLARHTRRIDEILDLVKDIANKSDLLALNAALEGTKAGEAGRGFSLVANQMQRLAEQVMGSVKTIGVLTRDIEESTGHSELATREAGKLAEAATRSAKQISMAVQQQQTGTQQATLAMGEIADVTRGSVAAAEQVVAAARQLTDLSRSINESVRIYKVG